MGYDFSISIGPATSSAETISDLQSFLDEMKDNIASIRDHLSVDSAVSEQLKRKLQNLINQVDDEAAVSNVLSATLLDILEVYQSHEDTLLGIDVSAANTDYGGGDATESPEWLALLDTLNSMANGGSVAAGILLKIVELIYQIARNNSGNTLIPDAAGNVLGFVGLGTDIAGDIMNALENGSTVNALMADLVVDLLLFGTGIVAEKLGEAAGAAVGNIPGAIIGKLVGGLVGDGVSVAMTIDWNGAKEGGVGKDALSDYIDNLMDKLWGDTNIAPLTA